MTKPCVLACLLLCSLVGTAHAEIDSRTLRYGVDFQGQNAGELEVVIARDKDGYLVTAISHLSLLATMFLESTTIVTRFNKDGNTFQLASGEEQVSDSGEVRRKFDVDVKAQKIHFLEGDPLPFDPTVRMDADAFPMLLVLDPTDPKPGSQLLSVSPKRGRLYTHLDTVTELVEVPAGQFDTRRVTAERIDDPSRAIVYWLRDSDRIPVRIETGKDGKKTTLVLLP